MIRIAIVDDDKSSRMQVKEYIERYESELRSDGGGYSFLK